MRWYEVWADESFDKPYLLVLGETAEGEIVIIDPKENDKVVFKSSDYNEAKLWLLEDEYIFVNGRMAD